MKKVSYQDKAKEDLIKMLMEKRIALRDLKFGNAGSKTRDVKAGANIRKEIARIMTELNNQKQD